MAGEFGIVLDQEQAQSAIDKWLEMIARIPQAIADLLNLNADAKASEIKEKIREQYPEIPLNVGKAIKLDHRLRVGPVATTVEVTDTVPMMDMQSPLISHNVPSEVIDRLPNSRSFQYFAITAPSVNA